MAREDRKVRSWTAPPRRAVLGGLLIAAAALGVFSAHHGASATPTDRFIVAIHDIPAGATIDSGDLGSIAIDLPDGIAAIRAEDVDRVTGRVASGTIGRLELIGLDDLYADDHFTRPGATRLALDLPPARAMYDVVSAGDTVSVLATDRQGSGTERLTAEALVISTSSTSRDSIGSSGMVRVVLSVNDSEDARAITDASVNSELTLVFVTPDETDNGSAVDGSDSAAPDQRDSP